MSQSYKVFVNNFCILFIVCCKTKKENNFLSQDNKLKIFDIYDDFICYFASNNYIIDSDIIVYSSNPDIFKKFKTNFNVLFASGGVVTNTGNQILIIKKNHMWDLPKGKLDQGETFEVAAFREIQEETGVKCSYIIRSKSYFTHHIYNDYFNSNILSLKSTKWFLFMAEENQSIKPQIEENILDVKWVDCISLHKYETYESVKDVVNFFIC